MANTELKLSIEFAWWVMPALTVSAYLMVPLVIVLPKTWSATIVDRVAGAIARYGMRPVVE